jgi:flagellar protein FlaG
MDSTIVPVDKPAVLEGKQRQADQSRASDLQAVPGGAHTRGAHTPENADTTVQGLVEASLEQNGREIVFGGRSIQFSFDKAINRVIVKVTDDDSGVVVRQIPPEEYLQLISKFREMFGVIFDEIA